MRYRSKRYKTGGFLVNFINSDYGLTTFGFLGNKFKLESQAFNSRFEPCNRPVN